MKFSSWYTPVESQYGREHMKQEENFQEKHQSL